MSDLKPCPINRERNGRYMFEIIYNCQNRRTDAEDALRAEVERLQAENAKLMETQAVCECGGFVKDHVAFDGHYPSERKTECPNLTKLCIAKRRIAELEAEVNRINPPKRKVEIRWA